MFVENSCGFPFMIATAKLHLSCLFWLCLGSLFSKQFWNQFDEYYRFFTQAKEYVTLDSFTFEFWFFCFVSLKKSASLRTITCRDRAIPLSGFFFFFFFLPNLARHGWWTQTVGWRMRTLANERVTSSHVWRCLVMNPLNWISLLEKKGENLGKSGDDDRTEIKRTVRR